jgi:hypothetical protein
MAIVDDLAEFAVDTDYQSISHEALDALKIRVLDWLGCAIGALDCEPMRMLRVHVDELGGVPRCSLIGGGRSAPNRGATSTGSPKDPPVPPPRWSTGTAGPLCCPVLAPTWLESVKVGGWRMGAAIRPPGTSAAVIDGRSGASLLPGSSPRMA